MDQDKLKFLQDDFIFQLKHLAPDAHGKWGVMNGQQMVEHFTDAVKNASGKLKFPQVNEGERLQKFRDFLFSDKPFRENTDNPLMSKIPEPSKHTTMQAAIAELQQEINEMVDMFQKKPALTTMNPFFGELDFTQNIHFLYKHAQHHLKQFGLLNKE